MSDNSIERITTTLVVWGVIVGLGFLVHSCRLHAEHEERISVQKDRIALDREKYKAAQLSAALEGCRVACGGEGVRSWNDGTCTCD